MPNELAFRIESQHARGSTRSDDDRFGQEVFFGNTDMKWPLAEIDVRNSSGPKLRAKMLCLLAHALDQFRAQDPLGKAGEILDHGRQRELAARVGFIDNQRLEIGARGINGSRQPGAPAPDDDHVMHDSSSAWIERPQNSQNAGAPAKAL